MKILYSYPIYTPRQKLISQYFLNDQKIMESKHEVRVCEFIYLMGLLKGRHFIFFMKNLISMYRDIMWCDITVCWFGKLHAFFAVLFSRILNKKTIIIAGGEEATNIVVDNKPYGLYSHPVKKWFAWFIFKYADKVVAVSKYNMNEILENVSIDPEKVHMVYHGFNSNYYNKVPGSNDERIVVNVGLINKENFSRKGLKTFVESAAFLPDVTFYMVGPSLEGDSTYKQLLSMAPPNVIFTGGLYGQDLIQMLSKSSVYVQLSWWESFGCSVAEAMLCECVPVVSNVASLPEVAGDNGFYISDFNPEQLSNEIRKALFHPEYGKKARKRIIEMFSLERRKNELLEIIDACDKTALRHT